MYEARFQGIPLAEYGVGSSIFGGAMRFAFLILLVSLTAARAEHFSSLILPGLISVIDGRPLDPDKFPSVVHLLYYDGDKREDSNRLQKCTGLLVGTCVISDDHCFDELTEHVVARNHRGEETAVSLKHIRHITRPGDGSGINGNDLAIARLEGPLPGASTSDILAYDWNPRTVVTKGETREDILAAAARGEKCSITGYGEEVADDVLKQNAADTGEKAAADLGLRFRRRRNMLKPRASEGDVRLLGKLNEIFFSKEMEATERALRDFEALSPEVKKNNPQTLAAIRSTQKTYNELQGLVFIPDPASGVGGDSGGPIFATINGKRKVIGFISAGFLKEKARSQHPRTKALQDARAMWASPVAANREWLEKTLKDLKCETSAPTADSMGEIGR